MPDVTPGVAPHPTALLGWPAGGCGRRRHGHAAGRELHCHPRDGGRHAAALWAGDHCAGLEQRWAGGGAHSAATAAEGACRCRAPGGSGRTGFGRVCQAGGVGGGSALAGNTSSPAAPWCPRLFGGSSPHLLHLQACCCLLLLPVQVLSIGSSAGAVITYLAALPVVWAAWGTRVAQLTSLTEMSVADVVTRDAVRVQVGPRRSEGGMGSLPNDCTGVWCSAGQGRGEEDARLWVTAWCVICWSPLAPLASMYVVRSAKHPQTPVLTAQWSAASQVASEPAMCALGPRHLAVGMNNQARANWAAPAAWPTLPPMGPRSTTPLHSIQAQRSGQHNVPGLNPGPAVLSQVWFHSLSPDEDAKPLQRHYLATLSTLVLSSTHAAALTGDGRLIVCELQSAAAQRPSDGEADDVVLPPPGSSGTSAQPIACAAITEQFVVTGTTGGFQHGSSQTSLP
jgi:hypothetical protein